MRVPSDSSAETGRGEHFFDWRTWRNNMKKYTYFVNFAVSLALASALCAAQGLKKASSTTLSFAVSGKVTYVSCDVAGVPTTCNPKTGIKVGDTFSTVI